MNTNDEKQLRLIGLKKGNEQGNYCVYQLALDNCYELSRFRIGLVSSIELLTSADGLLPGADPEVLNESIHTLAMLLYRLSVNDLENFDIFDAVLKGHIQGVQIIP